MNVKKLLLAALAVFVTFQVLDFVIHNLILSADYEASMQLWRPNMMDLMWLMTISSALFSIAFVYVFAKGYSGKGILEGIRFGLIFGFIISVIGILNQYIVYPIPIELTIKWIVFGLIEFLVAGIVVSLVYKPK